MLERTDSSACHWRMLFSHAIAVAAGIALTMTLMPRATSRAIAVDKLPLRTVASDFDRGLRAVTLQMGSDMCLVPSGNADGDFARAMILHHQGAIEMARLELLYGRDDRLRRLAQGIVIEQSQEIALMRSIAESSGASDERRVQ